MVKPVNLQWKTAIKGHSSKTGRGKERRNITDFLFYISKGVNMNDKICSMDLRSEIEGR